MGYLGEPNIMTGVLIRGRQEGRSQRNARIGTDVTESQTSGGCSAGLEGEESLWAESAGASRSWKMPGSRFCPRVSRTRPVVGF